MGWLSVPGNAIVSSQKIQAITCHVIWLSGRTRYSMIPDKYLSLQTHPASWNKNRYPGTELWHAMECYYTDCVRRIVWTTQASEVKCTLVLETCSERLLFSEKYHFCHVRINVIDRSWAIEIHNMVHISILVSCIDVFWYGMQYCRSRTPMLAKKHLWTWECPNDYRTNI